MGRTKKPTPNHVKTYARYENAALELERTADELERKARGLRIEAQQHRDVLTALASLSAATTRDDAAAAGSAVVVVPDHLRDLNTPARILRVMHDEPTKQWSPQQLAKATYVQIANNIHTALNRLKRDGKIVQVGAARYHLATPETPET